MAFSYNKKNLANTTITGAITPTQTSVTVADATVFSYAFFYATLMPSNEMSNASNSEIVLVTNIQGNTLTLVRGQENTIARSFPYGAVITNGIYTRDIDYARSIGRKVFMARDDGTDDTNTSYQITDPMIKNIPEEGSIITVEFDTPSYGAPTLGVNNGIGGLVQVSGTDIHITDSSGQIDSVEMYGDTEQQTYSGKNLYESIPREKQGLVGTLQADGTVAITGKATSNYSDICSNATTNLAAGTYTFSMTKTMPFRVLLRVNDSQNLAVLEPGAVKGTFTVAYAITQLRVFFYNVTSGTTYNETVGFQLEAGSTQTSFEPYVGGTASPNPDYPQNVNVVTGEQSVEIRGSKNLLPFTNQNFTKNNVTFSVTDGTLYLDGTSTGEILPNNQTWKDNFAFTLPAGTYTFSLNTVTTASYIKKKSDDSNLATVNGNSTKKATFTITEQTEVYLGFYMYNLSFSNLATTYQLERGSESTTYEPYKGVTKTVNLGKNLFDKDNVNTISAYIESSGSHGIVNDSASTCIWIPCETNTTYTISRTAGNVFRAVTTSSTPTTGITTSNYVGNDSGTSITISTGADGKYIVIEVRNFSSSSSLDDILATIQLERGSTATTYAPYFTPIELCKIGTYQDYIYKSGEDWYVKKYVGKFNLADYKDLDGWYVTGGGGHTIKYLWTSDFPVTDIMAQPYGGALGYGLSDYFTEARYTDLYNATVKVGFAFGSDGIYCSNNDWTLNSFRTWITGKVVNMYYIKTTPTDTQITNATLISELDALYNMLPEGVADVVVTGDLPGSLTIKYYQQGTGTYTAPIVGGAEIDGGDNEQVVELDSYLPYRLVYDTNGYWRVLNKGPKVTTGAIADGAVTPAKLSVDPGKYSAAETVIGSWIDGRPVYRKILTGDTPNGNTIVNHGITNFSRIINVYGWVQSGSNGSQPIQRVLPDAITQYGIGVGDFRSTSFLLQVGTNGDIRGKPYTMILEYIKTV